MKRKIELITPLTPLVTKELSVGDMVYLSGEIYTARDAAHKILCELIDEGKPLPFDFEGSVVFYAGPTPAKPGRPIGSVGPTTSGRMDLYSPQLIYKGLRYMIGKGLRSQEVISAIVENSGLYFAAIGGAAALMAKCVVSSEVIAFEELGPEAIRKLVVKDMPLIVAIDSQGNNIYK